MPDRSPGFQQRTAVDVGFGARRNLAAGAARLGMARPGLLVDANLAGGPVARLISAELPAGVLIASPAGEPTTDGVRAVAREIEAAGADGVVAVGGGSTLDTAKLARGFLASGVDRLADIPELLDPPPLPLIAMPTTAGTGAEMGAGAIVYDIEVADKILVRRQQLAADLAIADAELTLGLPAHVTAWTGLDAFAQALMAYLPASSNSISGQSAIAAMRLLVNHLPRAVGDGEDTAARSGTMLGSVLSAMAMYNAPPVYAGEHVFAEPLGAALRVAHGHAVAALLPGTVEFNADAFAPEYAELAEALGWDEPGEDVASAAHGFVARLRDLVHELGVEPLALPGGTDIGALAARCEAHEAYALNPRPIERADAVAILRGAFDGSFHIRHREVSDVR